MTVVAGGDALAGWRRRLNGRVLAVFPRLSSLADRITVEPAMQDEPRYLAAAMAPHGITPDVLVVGIEPTPEEIARARERAGGADAVVLFLYDSHLYPSNRALLDALQSGAASGALSPALSPTLSVILMRDPYDVEHLAPGVPGITAYGWRRCQLDAVLARLLS